MPVLVAIGVIGSLILSVQTNLRAYKKIKNRKRNELNPVKEKTKNFIVKVTDKELLSETGGIVQGMSGSPIIQNGRLVGAVTHVLVDDPTRGYGIYIENMLNAS